MAQKINYGKQQAIFHDWNYNESTSEEEKLTVQYIFINGKLQVIRLHLWYHATFYKKIPPDFERCVSKILVARGARTSLFPYLLIYAQYPYCTYILNLCHMFWLFAESRMQQSKLCFSRKTCKHKITSGHVLV